MALTTDIAVQAKAQYEREIDRYAKLARTVHDVCENLVDQRGIKATTQFRAKDPDSFHQKLLGFLENDDRAKIDQVEQPVDALEVVGDLAAVRVATYVEADRNRVVRLIVATFRGPRGGAVIVEPKDKPSGYRATHCQVLLPSTVIDSPEIANIAETSAEIQVCSMLAHVWNEIEHDIRYKEVGDWGSEATYRDTVLDEFKEATEQGDSKIEDLLGQQSEVVARALVDPVGAILGGLADFSDNGEDVLREVVRLGYPDLDRVTKMFLSDPAAAITRGQHLVANMSTRFRIADVDESLIPDPRNADVLLALVLEHHTEDMLGLYERSLKEGTALRAARIAKHTYDLQGLLDI